MEILRALGTLVEPRAAEHVALAEMLELGEPPATSAYEDLFLFQLYPYASVYLGSEGMLGGEARDRIAGFWRALDESPPRECDHLALMLSLQARLGELEEAAAGDERRKAFWRHARRAFFWEHLAGWLPAYLDKLDEIADEFYRRWGALVGQAIEAEAEELGRPEALSLHLRESPPLEDPHRAGGEAFISSLLAPVRSGMILVRSDLERAARELELGRRAGERSFVLKALLSQNPGATLAWLVREAARWRDRHLARQAAWGSVALFWAERAEETRRRARKMQDEAGGLGAEKVT